jgi:alpha-glucoside transport system permease protein
LASFRQIVDSGLLSSLWSTLVVALGATSLLVVVALLATPALSLRVPDWASRLVVAVLTMLAVAPVQMYAVPLRDAFTSLGVVGSRLPLIVVHVAAGLPLAVLILRAALLSSHRPTLDDALLGQTSPLTALRRLWNRAGAALVAVAVMEFVQVWNDFIVSLFVSGPGSNPLTIVLWGEARQFASSVGTIAASAVLSALVPVVVLLLVWRRWMVPGLTGGLLR